MTAQVYQKERINFFNITTPSLTERIDYTYDFYIGDFKPMTALKNDNNEFFSLGGSKENPLEYRYQGTGITEFNFNIVAPRYKESGLVIPGSLWELWIDGDKPYYFYFAMETQMIFIRTISVVATKNKTTKFKFRMTPYFHFYSIEHLKFYFEGSVDTVYSSITAKFIPDPILQINNQPIIAKEDMTLKKNRRYLVYALYAKTLQLNLDDSDEFEVGDWIEIKNMEFGKFRLNSMKYDIVMQGKSTKAKNGYIQSTLRGDFIRLECLEKSESRIILSDTNTVGTFTII